MSAPGEAAFSDASIASKARLSARRGWIVVVAAFVIMFVGFGCTYAFPAFFADLQETFGAPRAALSWVFSIGAATYFLLGAVSGPLADRFGAQRVALAGMALVGAGLLGASQAGSVTTLNIAIGLGVGLGVGFSYVPAIGAVQRWFVRQRGLASGIAVSGIGFGTVLGPKLAEALIDAVGWRGAYAVLGLFALVAGGIAALFLEGHPEKRGFGADGGLVTGPPPDRAALPGSTLQQALRSRSFKLLYAANILLSLGLFMPFVHLTPFAEDRGVDHGTAVTLFAMVGLGSIAGRFLIGGLADRLGRRRSFCAMYLGMAAMMLVWIVSSNAWQLGLFALVYGAFYGGFVALAPALIVDYFGPRNASGIIGIAYTSAGIGTLFGPPLAGYAFDLAGSYTLPIALGALAAFIGALLIWLLPDPNG